MLTENAKHHGLTSKVWTVQRATSSEQVSQQEQVNSGFGVFFTTNYQPL